MATMRTYDDSCRFAHALDLVGERWALLVVRELLLGAKRFTDLRAGLPQASPTDPFSILPGGMISSTNRPISIVEQGGGALALAPLPTAWLKWARHTS